MKKIINRLMILSLVICISPLFSQSQTTDKVVVDQNTFGAIRARDIGPAATSGRIAAIDAIQNDPRIIYVGSAGGGVWKSKNGGVSFKDVFEKYNQCIGAITIDQEHPDTVWVGTGEPWVRNTTSVGDGIYKTTNGGEDWKKIGLDKTERIARIVINPKNPDIVYVAAMGHLFDANEERGVFRTKDGGKTWDKVLYVDENTGCADLTYRSAGACDFVRCHVGFQENALFISFGRPRQRPLHQPRRRGDLDKGNTGHAAGNHRKDRPECFTR